MATLNNQSSGISYKFQSTLLAGGLKPTEIM